MAQDVCDDIRLQSIIWFVRLLIGSRMLRRRRIRTLLMAHLLRERQERDDEDGDEGGSEDHRLARLLIRGRIARRRRLRRLLLAKLLKEQHEGATRTTRMKMARRRGQR
jgi:hypothetical protein